MVLVVTESLPEFVSQPFEPAGLRHRSGPGGPQGYLDQILVPALLIQGTVDLYKAVLAPSQTEFYGDELGNLTDPSAGGRLTIVPVIGGSGPQSLVPLPYSLGLAAPANNAITVPITPELTDPTTYVVGSPHLTFDYSGIGTSSHVYAQIVDTKTNLVVGNIVTPVDVTLDGRSRQAEVDMEDVVWTYTDVNKDDLELQITGSATPYENFTSYGVINVSNVQLTLPTAGADAQVAPEAWPAIALAAV